MTEQFYVAIELAKVGRISVATEDFYVATELATTESSAAHDRVGHAKADAYDSVAPCCVVTKETILVRQTKPGAHKRGARATGELCRDKEFSVATDLDNDEKKKKTSGILGATTIVYS